MVSPKTGLGLLSTLLLPAVAMGQFECSTNADGNTLTIIGYTGTGGVVSIPGTIDGLEVTMIGEEAFQGLTTIKSVAIPDSVTNIDDYGFQLCVNMTNLTLGAGVMSMGDSAFYGCSDLTSVVAPASLQTIGFGTFEGCYELTNFNFPDGLLSIGDFSFNASGLAKVAIPASVTDIGTDAFAQCDILHSITVDPANPIYSSGGGVLFNKNQTALIQYPPGGNGGEAYSIPQSVNTIDSYAFADCYLTNISIPDSVTSIGEYGFKECPFTQIVLPNALTSIADNTFTFCGQLTSIIIRAAVTNISENAFSYCAALSNAYFLGTAPAANSTTFQGDPVTVNYLPGTSGWEEFDKPTAFWTISTPAILAGSVGLQTNVFGFTISWATNVPVVVEAATNLANPAWTPIATNTLNSGLSPFVDPKWKNFRERFYRLR